MGSSTFFKLLPIAESFLILPEKNVQSQIPVQLTQDLLCETPFRNVATLCGFGCAGRVYLPLFRRKIFHPRSTNLPTGYSGRNGSVPGEYCIQILQLSCFGTYLLAPEG